MVVGRAGGGFPAACWLHGDLPASASAFSSPHPDAGVSHPTFPIRPPRRVCPLSKVLTVDLFLFSLASLRFLFFSIAPAARYTFPHLTPAPPLQPGFAAAGAAPPEPPVLASGRLCPLHPHRWGGGARPHRRAHPPGGGHARECQPPGRGGSGARGADPHVQHPRAGTYILIGVHKYLWS